MSVCYFFFSKNFTLSQGAPIWWFHTGWREHFEEQRRKHLNKGKRPKEEEEEDIRGDSAIEDRIKRLKQMQQQEKPQDPLLEHEEEQADAAAANQDVTTAD